MQAQANNPRRQTHGAKITASLRENDVATSFSRNNDVIREVLLHVKRERVRVEKD